MRRINGEYVYWLIGGQLGERLMEYSSAFPLPNGIILVNNSGRGSAFARPWIVPTPALSALQGWKKVLFDYAREPNYSLPGIGRGTERFWLVENNG